MYSQLQTHTHTYLTFWRCQVLKHQVQVISKSMFQIAFCLNGLYLGDAVQELVCLGCVNVFTCLMNLSVFLFVLYLSFYAILLFCIIARGPGTAGFFLLKGHFSCFLFALSDCKCSWDNVDCNWGVKINWVVCVDVKCSVGSKCWPSILTFLTISELVFCSVLTADF